MSLKKYNNTEDKLLWDKFLAGDDKAYAFFYRKYIGSLLSYGMRFTPDRELVKDCIQDVFVKIWRSREKIDVYLSFDSFLFTIAYNTTMSLLRKRMSDAKSKEYLKSMQQTESNDQIVDELQFKELSHKVESLLKMLTPRQREIFLLSREEGLTHKEVAKKLNISESTVNNHLVATLKYLKSHFDNTFTASILLFSLLLP